MALAERDPRATGRDVGLDRWNSPEWARIRWAVYRTLLDMTIFPTRSPGGEPLPNALRVLGVEHDLIDAATSQPTERLLRLNPHLPQPGTSR
jgi:hypothetical protein